MSKKIIIGFIIVSIIGVAIAMLFQGKNSVVVTEKIVEQSSDERLKEKIGQMLIVGFRGTKISENGYVKRLLDEVGPGGIILFDYDVPSKNSVRNIVGFEQTKKLISDLQRLSSVELFIGIDQEGGLVSRLKPKYGFPAFASHQTLGKKDDISETEKTSKNISQLLASLGFNINFAPVVDVNVNLENPIIGKLERSFSSDPNKVSEHARAFINGQHANSVLSAIKHFPGHGSSRQDSHLGIVDVTKTYKESELIPYEKLIEDNIVDMVMTAHIINKNIDTVPVTLSKKYIGPILRERFNFDGVVVSDDMQMGAIVKNYGFKDAIIKAVVAGCDMIIISNNVGVYDEHAPYEAVEAIYDAVKKGIISSEQIEKSYERILKLKEKITI